jgi:myo-inositol-1(or 4)-monophosphatase
MANMALRAARSASQIILRSMDRLDELRIEEKGPNDFVSEVDRKAEQAIIEVLHAAYPDHGILGEESGEVYTSNEYTWIIDPLDGTLNFLQGIPHFCVSIGLMKGRRMEHAVIVDPVRNEEFVASRGKGAQLNGKRIRVSNRHRLPELVLGTGIPPHAIGTYLDPYIESMQNFTRQCRAIRRQGSAALDLAYTAAGRLDGFWEPGLSRWDIAAGILLVTEAGGFISDLSGGETYFETGNIVAANPKAFRLIVTELRQNLGPAITAAT